MNLVPLGSVCSQHREQVRPGEGTHLKYVGLESIESDTGRFHAGVLSKTPENPRANSFRFDERHVLYGKLRPNLNKVALPDFEGKCSTELVPLLPGETLDRSYLAYFLRSEGTLRSVVGRTAGSRMPRADMGALMKLSIPLPSLLRQREVVDLLARAEGIIYLRREAREKANELTPAVFSEMFGDPGENIHSWPVVALSEVAEVISGVAKGRLLSEEQSVELPYMRVANVKDGYLDLRDIKTMAIKTSELEKLLIEEGDLLMTEGGDPDKLGRGALWRGDIANCVHQNHVFKVRAHRPVVLPEYLHALTGSPYGKRYFLRVAKKTTGIASINKSQLCAFPVPVPPMPAQLKFMEKVDALRAIIAQQDGAVIAAKRVFLSLADLSFPQR